jgi:hypothetical protein
MPETDDKLEQLKRKYEPVFHALDAAGVSLGAVRLQDDKLFIYATADSAAARDRIFEGLQSVDPNWHDEVYPAITVAGDAPEPHTGQSTVNTAESFTHQDQKA